MQVHERERARLGDRSLRPTRDRAAERTQLTDALGGVEERAGMAERRVFTAHERFVRVHAARRPRTDRLIGHPQRLHRAVEVRLERCAIAEQSIVLAEQHHRVALRSRDSRQTDRSADGLDELVELERLREVAQRAVAHGVHRGVEARTAGDEDDRHVEVVLAHHAQ